MDVGWVILEESWDPAVAPWGTHPGGAGGEAGSWDLPGSRAWAQQQALGKDSEQPFGRDLGRPGGP